MATSKEHLIKFPRTRHLFDAGGSGVSRDDLLLDPAEEQLFYSTPRGRQQVVAIEEKVDGANLGISINKDDMTLRVQNRSHFVNSKTHRQFSQLDSWLSEYTPALYDVLEPGRHVLYGEWLYAKHSIHYTNLPGYFLAFDIYDGQVEKFLSWRERNRCLQESGIPVVRQIAETTIRGRDEIRRLLDTKSAYYDGPCEGLYLRVDDDAPQPQQNATAPPSATPYLLHRSKLVRPNFLQQIEEQWTHQQFTKNIVVRSWD